MDERDWLARQFQENRDHLRAVAYRMLGSHGEADDAIQEVWLRLNRTESEIENLRGWLTTVVARICLDMLRSRSSRREEPLGMHAIDEDPERDVMLADAVGPALLVVLDTLTPAERVAFVLHDMFDLSFEEIAPIVRRSPTAARQLASRARRRIQGGGEAPQVDPDRQREAVTAFLAASRDGDFDALVAVLASDVVFRVDDAAVRAAAANKWGATLASETRGATAVAAAFKGRAHGARPALIDGCASAVWAPGGQARAAFVFTVELGQIVAIDLVMEPARLSELDIEILSS